MAILAVLIAFETAVLVMIATPNVSDQYRAYFIERTTDCWPRQVSGQIPFGERVSFLKADARGTAANLKLCGWMEAAGTGTWSLGPDARLLFDVGGRRGPLLLELDLFPYVTETHPVQRLVPSVNGRLLAKLRLDAQSARLQTIVIPAAAIGEDGRIELALRFPDAQSLRDLGISDDDRRLAIRLIFLRLLPADADTRTLGQRLALPPFLEGRRASIEAGLTPLG